MKNANNTNETLISIKNLLSDTNDFKFKRFTSNFVDQVDVYHKGVRVAIIEGMNGALLREVEGCNALSLENSLKLEKMVLRLYKKAIKEQIK